MITSPDIETSVINLWTASGLNAIVPGSIKSGRRVPTPPQPYAAVEALPTNDDVFYTESGVGAGYVARFTCAVRVYGVGKSIIAGLLTTIGNTLDGQNWVVPRASFLYAFPVSALVAEDDSKKQGEDWWVGTVTYEVAASGVL